MKAVRFNFKSVLFPVLLSISFLLSCDKNHSQIPNVYVDIYIDLTDPLYSDIQLPGKYVYVTGGVNGIIIYRSSSDEFNAFERTCPFDPDCGKVYVDEANYTAVDSVCCGSEFSLLIDGAVTQGPSLYPLKLYACTYDLNSNMLHITN
jgi:nitrite reductase/ring-hydroxylating ferredoxin subunit